MSCRIALVLIPIVAFAACGDDGASGDADTGAAPTSAAATGSDDGGTAASLPAGSSDDGGSSGAPATDDGVDSSSGGGGSTGDGGSETTAGAGPTWNNFGEAFFESYCWECHGAGDKLRDYTMLTAVMAESASIRCGTAPASAPADNCGGMPPAGQFPIGANVPTDEERATLVAWIDAGLPED